MTNLSDHTDPSTTRRMTLGPPVYYRPVCQLTPWGFIGGPFRYQRTDTEEEAAEGPIIVDQYQYQYQSQTEGS